MNFGFIKVCCVTPKLSVCDCKYNSEQIIESCKTASKNGAKIIVFPELCITSYSCGDLFFQSTLQQNAISYLIEITKQTSDISSLIFVGLPFALSDGIYNVAAVLYKGRILALIPKTNIPNYCEFYERRYFTPYTSKNEQFVSIGEFTNIPFGTDILFLDKNDKRICVACEICEDLWSPISPSVNHCLNGATIIANLSAGNEIIGKADYRNSLVKIQSSKLFCAYLYANAGVQESTSDVVFAGHNLIYENGNLLCQSKLFSNQIIYSQIDVELLTKERQKNTSFSFSVNNQINQNNYKKIEIELINQNELNNENSNEFLRAINSTPFVPSNDFQRKARCEQVINLQAQSLARRIQHINCKSAIIGLSGGLDSTLALLVTCKAFEICNLDKKNIYSITMPCFGTTNRTYKNACNLAKLCGTSLIEIDIKKSVLQHFSDINQDYENHDIVYENAQARERTQVLMDYANKTNGIVIGTGDLSELALGWCTYNGDQMSMYGVNSSVPKTLVRFLVKWFSDEYKENQSELSAILLDILETPVSPELLPPTDQKINQITEDLVGPYELHDFFLFYVLRYGFSPEKIFFLAKQSELIKKYDENEIIKWLKIFFKRFFTQQFKRSCMPDGAKIGTVNLSPRGDWRMPSDANAKLWLDDIEKI